MGEVSWSIACLRVEDYLRAHRIDDREHLLRLCLTLIDEAKRAHAADPSRDPLDAAMDLVVSRTEGWFSRLADESTPSDPMLAARGRAIWFASDLHREWSGAFLESSPPAELLAAVRSATMQAGPALEFSSLTRTEVDYGPMEDIAGGTWHQFSWSHVLRAFVIWTFVFFASYGAWLFHFRK